MLLRVISENASSLESLQYSGEDSCGCPALSESYQKLILTPRRAGLYKESTYHEWLFIVYGLFFNWNTPGGAFNATPPCTRTSVSFFMLYLFDLFGLIDWFLDYYTQ